MRRWSTKARLGSAAPSSPWRRSPISLTLTIGAAASPDITQNCWRPSLIMSITLASSSLSADVLGRIENSILRRSIGGRRGCRWYCSGWSAGWPNRNRYEQLGLRTPLKPRLAPAVGTSAQSPGRAGAHRDRDTHPYRGFAPMNCVRRFALLFAAAAILIQSPQQAQIITHERTPASLSALFFFMYSFSLVCVGWESARADWVRRMRAAGRRRWRRREKAAAAA